VESITLIEHESLPIVPKRLKGQKALSTEHADALGKLERHFPPKTFTWGNHVVTFAHFCGVIALGNLTLEILPKIYGKETEPGSCRKALLKMLVKSRRLKAQRGSTANIALQKAALLDVFILHFCDQLHTELMQGMIRHYVVRNENIHFLRGRLRMEQQFKHNLTHKERLYCQYDELSSDNGHNQSIKHVLQLMMKLATGVLVRKSLTELLMRFDSVSDMTVNVCMVDNLKFNRSTSRYIPIFRQCRWFLQGLHPDVLVGHDSCITLLFDMNQLFESYVASVFKKLAWVAGKRMREQGPQKYMVKRDEKDQQLFLMKPDMTFLDNDDNCMAIADTKWKLLDEREKKLGIAQGDLYQIASYAIRYGVDRLALVYPKQQYLQNTIELRIQGTTTTLHVIPIDVTSSSELKKEKLKGANFLIGLSLLK
jgi:5-methylcytosine-specific restriction enzyme subunit McrC